MPRRLIAIVLAVIGIAAAVDFLIGVRYIDAVRDLDRQAILDPLMAVAVVLAAIVHFLDKRALDSGNTDGSITRKYLEANLAFYATVFLALWVFADWIGDLETGMLMDSVFIVVMGVTSLRLWRESATG